MSDDELDRQLVEEHDRAPKSPFFGEVGKIKVGKKVLRFYNQVGDSVTFQRGTDMVKITMKKVVKETKACSLGHLHETGKRIDQYEFFGIDFEMIDQLKEWAEQGEWVHPIRDIKKPKR